LLSDNNSSALAIITYKVYFPIIGKNIDRQEHKNSTIHNHNNTEEIENRM